MKLALAQIDARPGDFDGLYARLERQLSIAHEAGADLLCAPAPLTCGVTPGALVESTDFEHDLLSCLQRLAQAAGELGMACLVPAVLSLEAGQLFEAYLLRRGRVVPLRLTMVRHHEGLPMSPWSPPVFEVAGTRIAVTFDFQRDMESIPPGCDLVLYLPVNGFDMTDETSAAVAAVADGAFSSTVAKSGMWMACLAPVGGYDRSVYTGGSFVMDDAGHVVAQAPCFEEALLVQDVQRGVSVEPRALHELPSYTRELWLWEALKLHLRDYVEGAGVRGVAVPLDGSLNSALLAQLAVDALGSRNVHALAVLSEDMHTAKDELEEDLRLQLVRDTASRLHVRLAERSIPSATLLLDRDDPVQDGGWLRGAMGELLVADLARECGLLVLSPLCKTDYALRAQAAAAVSADALAPFGDVYSSELVRLARSRARYSAALPDEVLREDALEKAYLDRARQAVSQLRVESEIAMRAQEVLEGLDLRSVDAALEAYIDRGAPLEECVSPEVPLQAVALLALIVQHNEASRRVLPSCPIVSARSFFERAWPVGLAWSDMGLAGEERLRARDLADAEFRRLEHKGAARTERARSEIMGMLGAMLGLSPEQQQELMSEEGQRRMHEELQQAQEALHEMLGHGVDPASLMGLEGGFGPQGQAPSSTGFFSLN